MWQSFVDKLYNKDCAVKWLKSKNPDEEIVFASAATILEANEDAPIGLSTKRVLQKRGVLIITRNQLVLKNSVISATNIGYFLFLIYSLVLVVVEKNWLFIIPAAFFCIGIAQRWSFEKHILLSDIQDVKLEEASSMRGKYPLLIVYLAGKVIQIMTAQILNQDILQAIKPSKK